MKLLKCHIENFGKLSNFDYNFEDGLNTIKEQNGFGKTTFASFIKAMFYGLETKRIKKFLIDRKQYYPWQGGAFGGNIEFEINNKKYKIERFFGKKEIDDEFKLYDLSTNLESNDYTSNIGEEIFKINKEAYERSTFISGQNMETEMNDSLNAKLGNILESENDVNTSEKAIKLLDEAIKTYKKTGGRGALNEKQLQKTMIEQKIAQSKVAEKNYEERKKQNEILIEQEKSLKNELENESKIYNLKIEETAQKAKHDQYNVLKQNEEEAKNKLEKQQELYENNNYLDNKIKDNEEKLQQSNLKLNEVEENIKKKQKNKKLISILIIVIVILSLITIIFINKIIGLSLIAIDIVIAIMYFIAKNKIIDMKNEYASQKKEQQNIQEVIETLSDLNSKEKQKQKSELENLNLEYSTKKKIAEDYKIQNGIQSEKQNYSDSKELEFEKIKLENEIKIKTENLRKLNDEINYNKNQLDVIENNLEMSIDLENDLDKINQDIEEMKENAEILEKTKAYLEEAKEQFSSHYLSNMKNSFLKNISIINGENLNVDLDVNLNAKINEYGANKEIDYLSTGYKDLIYICMRLSLIEALFEDEVPFIILDDPFVNLDEDKIKNAINLLNKLSNKYQIIYFVCHESRK